MGKRGPPPKPSRLKKLAGTYRKDRAARNEVTPRPGVPERPQWLDAEARKEWDRVVPHLEVLGILSKIDGGMLADYCAAHSLAVNATKKYQRQGLMVKAFGGPQKNPMIKVAQEARAQAARLGTEFGLSPSARSRISAPDKDQGLAEANARMKAANEANPLEDKAKDFFFGKPPPKPLVQ